jgi:ribosomal protein S18 acetylase RimI-like enzyme
MARALQPHEQHLAVQALGRAFADDPLMRWLLPNARRRHAVVPWLQRTSVAYSVRYGQVHTNDEVTGVACWLPPGGTAISTRRAIRTGSLAMPLKLGPRGFRRLTRWQRAAQAMQRRHAPEPHWYLYVLGVDPGAQGHGVAREILELHLAHADADGLPCYLETQEPRNPPIYERFGFRVVEERTLSRALTSWGMRREPGGAPPGDSRLA